jgi:hypothetical protein
MSCLGIACKQVCCLRCEKLSIYRYKGGGFFIFIFYKKRLWIECWSSTEQILTSLPPQELSLLFPLCINSHPSSQSPKPGVTPSFYHHIPTAFQSKTSHNSFFSAIQHHTCRNILLPADTIADTQFHNVCEGNWQRGSQVGKLNTRLTFLIWKMPWGLKPSVKTKNIDL